MGVAEREPQSHLEKMVIAAILECFEDVESLIVADKVQSAQKSAEGRIKGQLLIGGKSFTEIVEGHEYCRSDIQSLSTHIRQKRTHVARLLPAIEPAFRVLWGPCKEEVDMETIDEQVAEALAMDHANGVLDGSIWASMEWKWQKK
ncbi:hypothetical protein FOCG_11902 [Fusarium oxysporum f. sp. radicis-lycopersici 26381]|nr:hypothetical protein FOCG_11902 [Fusarium oxysporum f. sp. radicis-lycopersici 26381]